MSVVLAGQVIAATPPPRTAQPPGPRLPDGITPLSYDLTLELDPELDLFTGHVVIAIDVAAPTSQLWLNAVGLHIGRVTMTNHGRVEEVALLDGGGASQMQGFALPHPVGGADNRTITLAMDYLGRVEDLSGHWGKDEQGLFRQRDDGRWYLYSQAESVFARKIVPCFDEPRWKPAWRVTEIVPRGQIALANAPVLGERVLPDGRREVRFAEIARLPSYLLAVAVGPFEIVDAGQLGRGHVPVRLVVGQGDGKRLASGFRELPRIIDELERYVDAPLPLAKLDLVAVPQFFGAMENPGLITVSRRTLLGGDDRVWTVAHELAHQWFGNAVTPAWWDHLWLSEGFASWLGGRVTASLAGSTSAALIHSARVATREVDDQPGARPLVHPVATSDDVEPTFDVLVYEKAEATIAMFEQLVGDDVFREAVRAYIAANAGTSVTTPAFLDALVAATRPEVGAAFASNLDHAGTPVVELALRCTGTPTIVASARDHVTVPVCLRFPVGDQAGEPRRACILAGAHTEQPLPLAACPAWMIGHAGGHGYYRIIWRPGVSAVSVAQMSLEERLARGDDAVLAFRQGDRTIVDALTELTALASTRSLDDVLAALAIAREVDPLIDDPTRPTWAAWLASQFADWLDSHVLIAPLPIDKPLINQVLALTRGAISATTLAEVRAAIDRRKVVHPILRIDAARYPDPLFNQLVGAASVSYGEQKRGDLLESLGSFPAAYAPRVVGLLFDPRFSPHQIWPAIAAMLQRGESRSAAWSAMHARIGPVFGALAGRASEVIAATGTLCEPAARAEVAADVTAQLATLVVGKHATEHALKQALAKSLAKIDRCIARRAAAGDIAGVLAATMPARGAPAPKP